MGGIILFAWCVGGTFGAIVIQDLHFLITIIITIIVVTFLRNFLLPFFLVTHFSSVIGLLLSLLIVFFLALLRFLGCLCEIESCHSEISVLFQCCFIYLLSLDGIYESIYLSTFLPCPICPLSLLLPRRKFRPCSFLLFVLCFF